MSSEYIFTNDTPVIQLEVEKAFNGLTDEERLYGHYLSKAVHFGSLITYFQTSSESPLIFTLFHRLLRHQSLEKLRQLAENDIQMDAKEWRAFLVYWSAFLYNEGNYRTMGDTKFVPDLPKDKFNALVVKSKAYQSDKELPYIWDQMKDRIYSLNKNELTIGLSPNGTTTLYSKNCTEDDSKLVKEFMESNKIEAFNNRLFKDIANNTYEIRMASVLTDADTEDNDYLKLENNEFNGFKFVLSRGDYSPILKILNKYLTKAQKYSQNEIQKQVIEEYVRHFFTGNLADHKEASRLWVKDKGPVVEAYMGLIDRYADPSGVRGKFGGFVAITDKELSKKLEELVTNAPSFLALLPWPNTLESDQFLEPDFTYLDVLNGSGDIPLGLCVPDYDEIKQNDGFKNLSLGNVSKARIKGLEFNFLTEEDSQLLEKYYIESDEVSTALHELLGHGSGKQLIVDNEKPNFDVETTVNPLTNEKISQWYKSGQTFESMFTSLAGPYEECKAECVALYLSPEPTILKIFGFTGTEADSIVYNIYLDMILMGLEGLKMYSLSAKKWLQAHYQARYVILRVLIEAVPELVSIKFIEKSERDGKPDLLLHLTKDPNLLRTKCREAIGAFLLKLQVFKSTADLQSAQQMFDKYSEVSDQLEYPYLEFRDIVLDRKKPRKLFVKSSTELTSDGKVVLKTYSETHEGLIESFISHHNTDGEEDIDQIVIDLWRKDCKHFV